VHFKFSHLVLIVVGEDIRRWLSALAGVATSLRKFEMHPSRLRTAIFNVIALQYQKIKR
jgi:hypothetical protein